MLHRKSIRNGSTVVWKPLRLLRGPIFMMYANCTISKNLYFETHSHNGHTCIHVDSYSIQEKENAKKSGRELKA